MSPSPEPFVPVIIIGAGRSGTNILRDSICALPHAGTWACDEINYIWRHGNASHPHDELSAEHATPGVRRYIRRRFARLAKRGGLTYVVEKTCANSLRIEFVDRVMPEARYIFVVRDGRDVVASAMKRWQAPLDMRYISRKARFVPLADMPFYAWRYLRNRLYRLFVSAEGRLASWGPRFDGMNELAEHDSLAAVCARQWRRCVERSEEGLSTVSSNRVLRLRYEDFVSDPTARLLEIADFLGIEGAPAEIAKASRQIRGGRIGGWRKELSVDQLRKIRPILGPLLRRYGYERFEAL